MNPRSKLFTKSFALILLLPAFICGASLAGDRQIVLNADDISYLKDRDLIEAKGSVEVFYSGTRIRSPRLLYNSKTTRVTADRGFVLEKDDINMSGDSIDYVMRQGTGSAEGVRATVQSTWITGKKASFSPEQIYLEDSVFSSCDEKTPHYKVSAQNMVLYPKTGWIAEYMGMFYVNGVPVFPVPTYVYDAGTSAGFLRTKNPAPLPEFGTNPTDGTYLHEKIVYRLSSYSYGMLSIDYGTKQGLGGGFESNYVLPHFNEGSVRLHYWGNYGWYGGASHTVYFGDDLPQDKMRFMLYQVLQAAPRKKYNATLDLSYRERINYEKVTQLPALTLKYADIPFRLLDFYPKAELYIGSVSEESTGVNVIRTHAAASLDYMQPLPGSFEVRPGLDMSYTGYGATGSWTKLLARIDLSKKLSDNLEAGAGWSHFFVNQGGTPFRYENYWFFPFDDARVFCNFKIGRLALGAALSYNLPLLTVRDIDYNATIGLHCFDVTAKYRAARGEFSVSANLISR